MRVLVLSRNYPSLATPTLGIWVESLVRQCVQHVDIEVISPIPYCPPLPSYFHNYTRYRTVPAAEDRSAVSVHYPRYLLGPGLIFHATEARLYYRGIVETAMRLHNDTPFDLIHAHFGYPDGVAATKLGRQLGIPVVVTDHAFWHPWMDDFPNVRHQTVRASEYWSEHVCVSHAQMIDISPYTNAPTPPSVIPLGYDPDTFFPPETASDQDRDTLLFAGAINYTKGFDILLQALQDLLTDFPRLKIRIAGGSNTKTKLSQETELKKLATDMGLEHCMQFLGFQTQNELAQLMRESTMLVSASRRETFGCVLVEAMGCGLPVVATSCGGPEDIVTDAVGILVEPENPTALADGIRTILRNRSSYTAGDIHAFASPRFSWDIAADQYISLYKRILLEAAADDDF